MQESTIKLTLLCLTHCDPITSLSHGHSENRNLQDKFIFAFQKALSFWGIKQDYNNNNNSFHHFHNNNNNRDIVRLRDIRVNSPYKGDDDDNQVCLFTKLLSLCVCVCTCFACPSVAEFYESCYKLTPCGTFEFPTIYRAMQLL